MSITYKPNPAHFSSAIPAARKGSNTRNLSLAIYLFQFVPKN